MASAPESTPVRVLAVDDREENLIALGAAFSGTPYELVSVLSGEAALAKLEDSDFAAILLDVQMPGIDGFETAKLIRQKPRSKNTPIIFVTAINHSDQYERKGYISGAVDFLFKPVDTEILMAKVGVFAELFQAKQAIQHQAELLKQQALLDQEYRLLKRAVDARDEFLSIASHELNTPMTPLSLQMQSFLKMLREGKFQNADPVRLERMLETAFGQVERLSRIIKDLVDVSRVTTGKLRLLTAEVSLLEVTESVLGAFSEEIRQLGCEVKLDARANPVGQWDRTRIEQVIVNLLSNALKYGLGKPVRVTVSGDKHKAVLRVRDHGIGIAAEDQKRIFDRFERAASHKNFGGLGLGLFITAEIVRLHGGFITVESSPDAGAAFTVELPLQHISDSAS